MPFVTRQELEDWTNDLADSGKVIIVEGPYDKKALVAIGIPAKQVVTLGKPLYQVVESVAEKHKHAVILTDFDKKGKELYGKLSKDLVRHGVNIDKKFREFLQKKTKLSHIEGINVYLKNLQSL